MKKCSDKQAVKSLREELSRVMSENGAKTQTLSVARKVIHRLHLVIVAQMDLTAHPHLSVSIRTIVADYMEAALKEAAASNLV